MACCARVMAAPHSETYGSDLLLKYLINVAERAYLIPGHFSFMCYSTHNVMPPAPLSMFLCGLQGLGWGVGVGGDWNLAAQGMLSP